MYSGYKLHRISELESFCIGEKERSTEQSLPSFPPFALYLEVRGRCDLKVVDVLGAHHCEILRDMDMHCMYSSRRGASAGRRIAPFWSADIGGLAVNSVHSMESCHG